jgi:hypothetical protein
MLPRSGASRRRNNFTSKSFAPLAPTSYLNL